MQLIHGDCLEVMGGMDPDQFDTIITDPPYGLEFMGKGWDRGVPGVSFWSGMLRVAKPGAFLLAFGGTRTFHRMACAIEDAGWEIRDCIMWVYGSGFPKSHNFGKEMDGWAGYGTALKPAWEPIIVAMKPCAGTFAKNAERHGVAGLNIDGGRVPAPDGVPVFVKRKEDSINVLGHGLNGSNRTGGMDTSSGRWPANVIHDGSDEVVAAFPGKAGGGDKRGKCEGKRPGGFGDVGHDKGDGEPCATVYADAGSAARFFYCAKASRSEREAGMDGAEERPMLRSAGTKSPGSFQSAGTKRAAKNNHPTVKPVELMRYLARLTKTPTGGHVLDPFMGSGTTGIACAMEGRQFTGIEREAAYMEIAKARLKQHN